jgi:hypothetical protein
VLELRPQFNASGGCWTRRLRQRASQLSGVGELELGAVRAEHDDLEWFAPVLQVNEVGAPAGRVVLGGRAALQHLSPGHPGDYDDRNVPGDSVSFGCLFGPCSFC